MRILFGVVVGVGGCLVLLVDVWGEGLVEGVERAGPFDASVGRTLVVSLDDGIESCSIWRSDLRDCGDANLRRLDDFLLEGELGALEHACHSREVRSERMSRMWCVCRIPDGVCSCCVVVSEREADTLLVRLRECSVWSFRFVTTCAHARL